MRNPNRRGPEFSLVVLLILCLSLVAGAATKTWDGSASTLWGNSTNWTPSVVPANGNILVFPATPDRFIANNDLSNVRLDSIRFEGTNFYVLEGNGITLSNGIIQNQTASGADFENPITLGASQVFTNGAAFLTFNGDLSLGARYMSMGSRCHANGWPPLSMRIPMRPPMGPLGR